MKEAIVSEDETQFRESFLVVQSALFEFIRRNFRVRQEDAEDAVQQSIIAFVQSVRRGNIVSDANLGAYINTICKRELYKITSRDTVLMDPAEFDITYDVTPHCHLERSEKAALLAKCLSAMRPEHVEFILDWYTDPDIDRMAAERRTSRNSIWTRKSRILRILVKCVANQAK